MKVGRRPRIRAAIETVVLDLRQMRETCRQKIDECPGFRRQIVAVRMDGVDGRFLGLVFGQQADQPPGPECVGDEIVRSEDDAGVLERGRQQRVAAVGR